MWWHLWQGLLGTLSPQVPQSLGQNLRLAAEAEMRCLRQGTREAEKAVSQPGTLNQGSPMLGGGCESIMTPQKMHSRCPAALTMNPEHSKLFLNWGGGLPLGDPIENNYSIAFYETPGAV